MRRSLIALALLAGCGQVLGQSTATGVSQTGRFVWSVDEETFGGLSAIELSADGSRYLALSDRGTIWSGTIERRGNAITALTVDASRVLRMSDGALVGPGTSDSEGLALAPDGTAFVSFEGPARVVAYGDLSGPGQPLPRDPAFERMQPNSALEALAIGPDGALYTLPERSGRAQRPYPVYRLADGAWSIPFRIPRDGAFLPVGADIGPDGLFYLLERDFTGIGFRSRVRRFDLTGAKVETLLQTRTGVHDNLEGISVWRDDAGDLRMTLIADDNFKFFQTTEIVEYRVAD